MITRLLISFFIFFFTLNVFSQKKQTNEQYIEKYYKIAIEEMQKYKIPASITLAQGILESGSGNSTLAKKANNHFGIKCHSSWKGKGYFMDDDAKDECFRVYKSPESSFVDHSAFLTKRGRYEFLFTDYATTDYKKWAKGLRKAGYATNPKYPQLLISLIERYHLYKYDKSDFLPKETVQEDVLVLEEGEEEYFVLEETNEYIKALMGRNVYYSDSKKGIFIFNRIKTIKAKGRTPLGIAVLFDVNLERLKEYNDLAGDEIFKNAQNVFLQPKRFQASQKEYLVKPGDSMWEISQMFGIKLKSLYKKNLLVPGQQVKPGETLNLRKKRKSKVETIAYKDVLQTKRALKEYQSKKGLTNTSVKPLQIKSLEKKQLVEPIEVTNKYTKEKYVDKNEELEKLINEILVVESSETIQSTPITNVKSNFTHKVKQGETLYFISKKYNISIDELKILNNLQDNGINIDQDLIVSQTNK